MTNKEHLRKVWALSALTILITAALITLVAAGGHGWAAGPLLFVGGNVIIVAFLRHFYLQGIGKLALY